MVAADGQFEGVIWGGCSIHPGAPAADIAQARAIFNAACQPAEPRKIERALAELSMLCKSKAEETDDLAARLAIFANKLGSYPADVAMEAIKRWGNSEKWFPSWAELRMKCDLLGSKRMAVRDALKAIEP